MTRIIELLLNNLFIVVIIIGALASLFGKAGSKNRPRQRRIETQQEQHKPVAGEWQQDTPYELDPVPSVYRSAQQLNQQVEADASEREAEEARRLAAERKSLERKLRQVAAKKELEVQRDTAASLKLLGSDVRPEDLRKAVIWAEILGPPRAKRHYRK